MSLNLWCEGPDQRRILTFLVEGWRRGLKTLMYYCHTSPAAGTQATSIRTTHGPPAVGDGAQHEAGPPPAEPVCQRKGADGCVSCGV